MEVRCELESSQAVYLAGEEVGATIVFSLPPTAEWEVNLAWATVQIHCFCTVNHNKVQIPSEKTGKNKTEMPTTLMDLEDKHFHLSCLPQKFDLQ